MDEAERYSSRRTDRLVEAGDDRALVPEPGRHVDLLVVLAEADRGVLAVDRRGQVRGLAVLPEQRHGSRVSSVAAPAWGQGPHHALDEDAHLGSLAWTLLDLDLGLGFLIQQFRHSSSYAWLRCACRFTAASSPAAAAPAAAGQVEEVHHAGDE
eukprot:4179224-Pyramimonas_sp.AAC.1